MLSAFLLVVCLKVPRYTAISMFGSDSQRIRKVDFWGYSAVRTFSFGCTCEKIQMMETTRQRYRGMYVSSASFWEFDANIDM